MKIKYTHISAPDTEKVYDTVKSLRKNPFVHVSQEEFDKMEIEHMKADCERGIICHFEIIQEEQELNDNEQN